MAQTSLPQPHEQRKIEGLLLKLSKMKPVSVRPGPTVPGVSPVGAAVS
jgi:hypothetical protein